MKYIDEIYTNTYEIKRSKFIAVLTPYKDYVQTLKQLKHNHPKARHFVVAFRHLNEFEQIVEHCSDSGEPKGTSGKPSLMVMQGSGLINCGVIIVRYFGGVKLGTGGLVRAYSDAVNLVINTSELYEYAKEVTKTISLDYSELRKLEYESSKHSIEIVEKIFEDKVTCILKAKDTDMKMFEELSTLNSVTHIPHRKEDTKSK